MATRQAQTALARVTISGPKRRIDVALPEDAPLAEFLDAVLRHSGDDLADVGQTNGGWVLRRADGERLSSDRSLAAHGIRDGEILYLVPRRETWPELEYDDIADSIADGSQRYGGPWTRMTTRRAGLSIAAGTVGLGIPLILSHGPDWSTPTWLAGIVAIMLLVGGLIESRMFGDPAAGAVVAGLALPYATLSGLLLLSPDLPVGTLGAPHLLISCLALLGASLIGFVVVGEHNTVFAAGATAGLFGLLGAGMRQLGLTAEGSAAAVTAALVAILPVVPLLAARLGRLPIPELPASTKDLLHNQATPPHSQVYAAVVRSDEMITGILIGNALALLAAQAVLLGGGSTSAILLLILVAAANLIRVRTFSTVRHRLPLLIAGLGALSMYALNTNLLTGDGRLYAGLAALGAAAFLALASGTAYSVRPPHPVLRKAADWVDVLLLLLIIPVACSAIGLFGYVRGLGG